MYMTHSAQTVRERERERERLASSNGFTGNRQIPDTEARSRQAQARHAVHWQPTSRGVMVVYQINRLHSKQASLVFSWHWQCSSTQSEANN